MTAQTFYMIKVICDKDELVWKVTKYTNIP